MDDNSLARLSGEGIKVALKVGGGPPPGYQWYVFIVDIAYQEAMAFLAQDEYDHLARQVRELATCAQPTACPTVDVRSIEDYWEIRDKGGILGKKNVRVFFCLDSESRSMSILSVIKKESERQTPPEIKVTVRRRARLFRERLRET